MNQTTNDNLIDQQIVERLIRHDRDMETWFFSVYCAPILQSVNRRFFHGGQPMEKMTNDFYLHLKKQDWHALRQYRPTGALKAWLTTVATNLFMPCRVLMLLQWSRQWTVTKWMRSWKRTTCTTRNSKRNCKP